MTNALEMKKSNLVLPTTYYELDREEMSYVDGGVSVATYWWGTRIHLTYSEADDLLYTFTRVYGATGAISAIIPEPLVTKIISVMSFINLDALTTSFRRCNGANGINIDLNWMHYLGFLAGGLGLTGIIISSAIKRA